MSPRIQRIEDAGPARKARRLFLDDGGDPRTTSGAAVKALGLAEDADYPGTTLEDALADVEPTLAKERALQLLGYRERSTAELTTALCDSGYSAAIARAVVERMTELGLVDDERFAAMWVRSRVAAGFGLRRISRELAQKGVEADLVASVLASAGGAESELDRAIACLGSRRAVDRKSRDRLVRRLVTRGYELAIALRAVDAVSPEANPGESD